MNITRLIPLIPLLLIPSSYYLVPLKDYGEVSWNDPRTNRSNYRSWYSYNKNKPPSDSKSGFFFIDGKKLFWSYYNTECIPDHKHIELVGYLDRSYTYRNQYSGNICTSNIRRNGKNLIWDDQCVSKEIRSLILYLHTKF